MGEDMLKVKVVRLAEAALECEVKAGTTVADLIEDQNIDTERHDLMLNGVQATDDLALYEGAVLTLAPRIKAGN